MNVAKKVADIKAAVDALTAEAQQIISEVCVEWLNGPNNKYGATAIVFGGGTPSFNDGDPCTFNLYDVWATNMPVDEIDSPHEADGCVDPVDKSEDDEYFAFTTYNHPEFESVSSVITQLDSIDIIERCFCSYGFVAIITKDGQIVEKEFEMEY